MTALEWIGSVLGVGDFFHLLITIPVFLSFIPFVVIVLCPARFSGSPDRKSFGALYALALAIASGLGPLTCLLLACGDVAVSGVLVLPWLYMVLYFVIGIFVALKKRVEAQQ